MDRPTHYPSPDRRYPKRHKGAVRRPDDGRLKMHPRVAALAAALLEMAVDEERPLPVEYRAMPIQTPNGDAKRIVQAFGLDGVYRFDHKRLKVRRTA